LKNGFLFSHPGCPPFAQQAARALFEVNLLSAYVTTFSYQSSSTLGSALKLGMGLAVKNPEKQLSRRRISEVPEDHIVCHPLPELFRTAVSKSLGPIAADLVWDRAEQWFDRTVARNDLNGERATYGYEYAALATFKAQKARGGLCVYDLPIAHHKLTAELLQPEAEQFPETQTRYDAHLERLAPKRNERKDEELALADHVIVASSFTKSSLTRIGFPESKVSVVPYGAPSVNVAGPRDRKAPFIFLSAGTQSVRKGVHYTLEAWRRLAPQKGVELWLIGAMQLPQRLLDGLPGKVVIKPTVPKSELNEIYQRAGVLVFPSLVEGFGMVITEAMAHGLPVITTPHTAGPELIEEGRDGFIVPIRDVDALTSKMQWCLDNRDELDRMGMNAAAKAAAWQWSDYRAQLGKLASRLIGNEVGTVTS
jgi:glycosyltransferase involved in cell wall biosynthesis